ncbi:MAG: hypothetical protein R2911_26740 [Caldilineaceae bacterium]
MTKRSKGSSTYTIGKKVTQLIDAVTAFSARPLTLILWMGGLITLGAMAGAGVLAARGFLGLPQPVWGWLLVSLWLLGGLVLASVGLVGVYLARVFTEVKQRPRTIVRAVYEGEAAHDRIVAAGFPMKANLDINSRLIF